MTEADAHDWLLAQCEGSSGVHYRQDGDEQSSCGDQWSKHTTSRDFVTCESCKAILRGAIPRSVSTLSPRDGFYEPIGYRASGASRRR